MKETTRNSVPVLIGTFILLVMLIFALSPVQADAASEFKITSLKQTDDGIYVKWNAASSVNLYKVEFSESKSFSSTVTCTSGSTSFTYTPSSVSDGDTFYVRVSDYYDDTCVTSVKSITIKTQYSYEVKVVNPYCDIYTDNSFANIMVYVKTENKDGDFSVVITDKNGDTAKSSSGYALQTYMFPDLEVEGWCNNGLVLPDGILFEESVDEAGTYTISIVEKTGSMKITTDASTTVKVQDYDTAREAWLEEIIEESGADDSSLTNKQKMQKVCSYLLSNYKYTTNSGASGSYVSLFSEKGTLWQKKQLHSLNSPSILIEIGEKFGMTLVSGYTYTGDYSYHAYVVDEDGNFYCACNVLSTGTIDLDALETISLNDVLENSGAHDSTTYTVTKAATCTSTGTKSFTCDRCGTKATKTIAKTSHSYSGNVCKNCGKLKTSKVSSATVTLSYTSCTYNGSARKPGVTVKVNGTTLKKNTDYTVTYSNNTDAGTAKVTIKGKGSYSGSISTKFTIKKKSISSDSAAAKASLSTTTYTYNSSKTRKPSVTLKITLNGSTVKLTKGTDFKVAYASGRKSIGKYKVKITGTGNYKGTITKYFKIVPGKVTVSSAKSSSSSKLTVKWKKVSGSVKYQIAYRKKGSSTWHYKKVSASTYKKTISGLTSGKTYYVKVRAYKTVDGTTYKGSWSKTQTVKVT